MTNQLEKTLFADGARGIYIPQHFAESAKREFITNLSELEKDLEYLLKGPEAEYYWDSWTKVLDNCRIKDNNGNEFFLEQDGDLWVVPKGFYDEEENSDEHEDDSRTE